MANQTNTYNRAYRALMANAVACVLEKYPDATAQRIHDEKSSAASPRLQPWE